MKFGKQLQGTMVAEWSDYYVDYKTLKKEIKAISSTDASPPAQVERFVELLVEQLEGVNMFFTTEQASVVAKWKTIDVLMIQAPTAADKAMMIQWLRERLRSNSDSRGEKGSDTTLPTGRMAAKLKASMHQLSLFCDVYDAAQRLSQYVAINYVAFVKGMKKFEKRTALSVGHIFMPRLQRAVFFNSPALAILLAEVDFSAKDLLLRLGCGGAEADMLDEFRCSLCHELMRQPIVLACSHRFCWQCTAQASAVASTEGEWCCPTCRCVGVLRSLPYYQYARTPRFFALAKLTWPVLLSSRPQVLSPELYCVATSLSTLVERHMPSGANTRDGNLMEARKASMAAAACSSAASSEPAQAISYFATAVASPAIDRYQQRHTASPRQLDGAEALLSAASDITIGTMPDASALPASVQLQGYDGAMPARFSGAIATHGQDVAAAEEPTMAVAIAVDPSNSIIASTKELSYYDDLVALADVELPTWPFDLHDSDLTDMLPEIETHDQPHLDQITFHPLVPQGVELLSATATQLQLGNSAVLPDAHSAGMQAAAPIGPASRAEAMIKPKEPGHKRKTSSTHTGAGAANAGVYLRLLLRSSHCRGAP